jgi:hypothetical protein
MNRFRRSAYPRRPLRTRIAESRAQGEADREAAFQQGVAGPALDFDDDSPDADDDPKHDDRKPGQL